MRGISTGAGEYRIDSQVSVYLDDQPMTSISQQADVRLVDIERVEVLPGPQGTLFGSSAQAGTIRYVTNKPDISGFSSEVAAEVGTTKGGEESYDVSGWVNIPVSDNFAHPRRRVLVTKKAATSTTSSAPTLMGDDDECGHRRGRLRTIYRDDRRPPRGTLDDQPELESARHGHLSSAATRWATGRPIPFSATTRSRASSTNGATTSGTRLPRRSRATSASPSFR